ncbi:MAG: hypothetical protein U0516_04885 [Candidatus Saccharibacteria bacterium]
MAKQRFGLTVIELILSLGIILILFAVSVPLLRSFLLRNDLDVVQNTVVQDTYRAINLATSGERDSNWGVKITTGQITVFSGNSYATRNVNYDETYSLASGVTISGQSEYVFSKFSGIPINTGTTTLTNQANETRSFTVSSKGEIEEQ